MIVILVEMKLKISTFPREIKAKKGSIIKKRMRERHSKRLVKEANHKITSNQEETTKMKRKRLMIKMIKSKETNLKMIGIRIIKRKERRDLM